MTTINIESESSEDSKENIRNFLNAHYTGVLATADKSANPHTAVVFYKLEDDFGLTFGTKTETQKYHNMDDNNQVAFLVYDEKQQATLTVFGHVEEIKDEQRKSEVYYKMIQSSSETAGSGTPPAERLVAGDYAVFRLLPQTIKLAVYGRPVSEDDDLFETILFSSGA